MRWATVSAACVALLALVRCASFTADTAPDNDAGAPTDSGPIAADSGACDATYCDDFEAPALDKAWLSDDVAQQNGGSAAIDETHAHSPTRAMKSALKTSSNYGAGRVFQNFPSKGEATVELWVFNEGNVDSIGLCQLEFKDSASSNGATLILDGRGKGSLLLSTESDSSAPIGGSVQTPSGRWFQVVIHVDFVSKKVTATLDGQTNAPLSVADYQFEPLASTGAGTMSLIFGLEAHVASQPINVWFDDLKFSN